MFIDPLRDLLVAGARFHKRFEVVPLKALESEQHVVERTIKMVIADVPPEQGTAFVDRSPEYDVTAHLHLGAARRFLRQIFS